MKVMIVAIIKVYTQENVKFSMHSPFNADNSFEIKENIRKKHKKKEITKN